MLPELCPSLGPGEVALRWFRRLQLILGLRKPKHAGKTYGYYFKCPLCINHQLWFDSLDESYSHIHQHNRLYHYGKGN